MSQNKLLYNSGHIIYIHIYTYTYTLNIIYIIYIYIFMGAYICIYIICIYIPFCYVQLGTKLLWIHHEIDGDKHMWLDLK